MARSPAGAVIAAAARGQEQVIACLEDARRAAEHGFRSVLVADLGVLAAFDAMRRAGVLPRDMQAKVSVMLPVANPAAAQVVERLGANTLNRVARSGSAVAKPGGVDPPIASPGRAAIAGRPAPVLILFLCRFDFELVWTAGHRIRTQPLTSGPERSTLAQPARCDAGEMAVGSRAHRPVSHAGLRDADHSLTCESKRLSCSSAGPAAEVTAVTECG
jgi:hypothetical protein